LEKTLKAHKYKYRYQSISAWILVVSVTVSFITLIIYLAEVDFSDENLVNLLLVLRYSAFVVCLCALYKLLDNIIRIIFRKQKLKPKKLIIFLGFCFYGLGIFLLEAFIIAVSAGNG